MWSSWYQSEPGPNTVENRALIERALHLFEDMNATGWIEEARAAVAAA